MATRTNDASGGGSAVGSVDAGAEATGRRNEASTPADLPPGTLVQLFFDAVDRFDRPDAQLYRAADGWQPISHRRMVEDVRALVGALDRLGIQRGDRIALLAENRPEWALVDYALLCAGVLTVPIYPTLPPNQLCYIIQHAGARMIFVSNAEQAAKVAEVRDELPTIERVVAFDEGVRGADSLQALLAASRGELSEETLRTRARRALPDDVATLIYTSGTTGEPKGVMLTHDNLYSNVQSISRLVVNSGSDTALSFLPLSHVLQRMVDYLMFANGTTLAYVARIDDVAQALVEVRPTIAVAVPRVYEKLYAKLLSATGVKRRLIMWARGVALEWSHVASDGRTPGMGLRVQHALADRLVFSKLRARLGGRLRFFVSGGAPLSTQIAHFFSGAGVTILEGYGLTETSPVTNVNTEKDFRIGTVGKPVPGTEVRIAEDGEILIRGRQVMKGYFENPKATAEVLEDDGWFHTGDIGAIDDDGFLRITDRKKELLVTAGGKNIAPQPIQNAAKMSQWVAEAVMIGDRRPFPILLVVPNFEAVEHWARAQGIASNDHKALIADVRVQTLIEEDVAKRLADFARYELPKKVVLLERELSIEHGEITPTLKVKRRVVERQFSERIEAQYGGETE
jgi:long-chain acyl-CoA synthetase